MTFKKLQVMFSGECPGVEFLCGFSFFDLFLASGIAVVSHADIFTRGYNQQPSSQSGS